MTNYTEIKKRLIQEYNENVDQINSLTHRITILSSNELGSRTTQCLGISLIPWLGTFFTTPSLVEATGIPFNVVQSISYVSALLVGTVAGLNLPLSKARRKEFLSEEKVRKEKDIIELETRCQMKKSHLLNMNKAIKQAYDSFCAKEKLESALKNGTTLEEDCNAIPTSIQDKITNLTYLLKKKENQLHHVTSKKTLRDLFWRTRNSYYTYFNTMMSGFTALGLVTISYALPGVPLSYTGTLNSDVALAGGIIAGVTGCAFVSGTILYKRHTKRKVYNQLNEELGKYGLSDNSKEDNDNLETNLIDLILEIKTIKMELELTKQKLADRIAPVKQEEPELKEDKNLTIDDSIASLSHEVLPSQIEPHCKTLKKMYPPTQQEN